MQQFTGIRWQSLGGRSHSLGGSSSGSAVRVVSVSTLIKTVRQPFSPLRRPLPLPLPLRRFLFKLSSGRSGTRGRAGYGSSGPGMQVYSQTDGRLSSIFIGFHGRQGNCRVGADSHH